MRIDLTVNGGQGAFDIPDGASLLELLRDHAGITSPKDGCSPQGQCGACLVLVDGHPKTSCAVPAKSAAGKSVLTLEGVPEQERHIYGEAFARTAGLQCGFCIPGIALRMKSALDQNPGGPLVTYLNVLAKPVTAAPAEGPAKERAREDGAACSGVKTPQATDVGSTPFQFTNFLFELFDLFEFHRVFDRVSDERERQQG